MNEQAPILIIVIPLIFAFINPLIGRIKKELCFYWAVFGLMLSSFFSITTLVEILNNGVVRYRLGNWSPPWGIEYVLDHFNGVMLVIISFISLITAIYAKSSIEREAPGKTVYFYTVYLLQVVGFLGITGTGDMFNLYVFLEIASLSGYALIAIGEDGAPLASFRYIIMGTIGACFYLIGVGYIYIMTGSLNMGDLSKLLPAVMGTNAMLVGFAFLIVGICLKMGLFPLHLWLSDAYTHAPSSVSSLLAPLFTKISAAVIIRVMFKIFSPSFSIDVYPVTEILGWVASIGVIYAGIMALAQKDLKRMLCYLIIAEIGYIAIGIASSNRMGLTGSILHIFNDVFMMACLFTVVGAVYYQTGKRSLDGLFQMHRKMPVTLIVLLVGALSVVGVPPFCGFFSKWYFIIGLIQAGKWVFLIAMLASSLINAILFFRIIERAFVEPREEEEEGHAVQHGDHEDGYFLDKIPVTMMVPMVITAIGIILLGFFSNTIVNNVILPFIPSSFL
ncbi:complex I subunit 5 family protein [Spirochaetota bacterium]